MATFDAVVIGAGSVGTPVAWELARRGWRVCVLEQRPSVGRGQNRAAIGGIRATHSDPAKIRVCQRSIEIVKSLEAEHGFDVDWVEGGYLFPVYDEAREQGLRDLLVRQKQFGLDIDWISPEAVQEQAPGITTEGLRGGTFSPGDGSASPLKVADAYYALALREGVDFRFGEAVAGFVVEGNEVVAVDTAEGRYEGGVVIDASGAGARPLGQLLGLDVPVYPDSHEAGLTEPVRPFFRPMIVDIRPDEASHNYYFYQNAEGQVVFCITPEPQVPGLDCDNTSSFLPLVVKRMVSLYPRLRNLRVRRTWRGLYPMTPDGFPVVGRPHSLENLWLAVGMCGQGFMLGPGLGEVLAETLVERSDDWGFVYEQLSLYRSFSGEEMLK